MPYSLTSTSYDPAATRSKEEYSGEPSDLEKPPDP